MNKSFILAAGMGLLAALSASAQNTSDEDSVVVKNPQKVTVVTTKDAQRIEILGSEVSPNYRYSRTVNLRSDAITIIQQNSDLDFNIPFMHSRSGKKHAGSNSIEMGNFGIGFVNAIGAPSGMDVKMGSSFEFFLENVVAYKRNFSNKTVSIGVGIDWRNYRMTDQTCFIKDGPNIGLGPMPGASDVKFSRLKIFSWTMPVMYSQSLGHHVGLSLGPILSVNTYGSLKTRYTDENGAKHKYFNKNIHQTPVTVDFKGELNFGVIGVYVKYSPCNVLQSQYGPKFQSLSMGIVLF
jgi:hypothetical protein